MSAPQQIDYLVIGQGLAGTLLVHTLLEQGQRVLILASSEAHTASDVAAGLWNPVISRRYTKTWLADEIVPFATQFYPRLEQLLGDDFFYRKPIYKLFTNAEERRQFQRKMELESFAGLVSDVVEYLPSNAGYRAEEGACKITAAGYLDVKKFTGISAECFAAKGIQQKHHFVPEALVMDAHGITYGDIAARKIIFCEGAAVSRNPWFGQLPWKHTKGELLTVNIPGLPTDKGANNQAFAMPLQEGNFRVGATYDWDHLDTQTTAAALDELTGKLAGITDKPFSVVDHQAGIRPTIADRRPVIGFHPAYPHIGIFNGLGSKGVLLGPYFAAHFWQYLQGKQPLMEEVAVARFFNSVSGTDHNGSNSQ